MSGYRRATIENDLLEVAAAGFDPEATFAKLIPSPRSGRSLMPARRRSGPAAGAIQVMHNRANSLRLKGGTAWKFAERSN
jgi:hypothetical protein